MFIDLLVEDVKGREAKNAVLIDNGNELWVLSWKIK